MQSVIPVKLPQQSYNIAIAAGGLSQLGSLIINSQIQPLKLGHKILVVSDSRVFQHYGQLVLTSLEHAGFEVANCLLSPGERFKTLSSVQKIYDSALANRLERSSTIVALGGGVVGDMAGFAAATWLRGISVIQVPTTLLAMVDASIGGKTGVNHPKGKNLIGAFHQPRLVVIDPNALQTLPGREFRAAIAEVIKYGVIWDAELFTQLEQCDCIDQLRHLSPQLLQEILTRSCQAKVQVVTQDEKEAGLRAILNYGHTIGHAIESLTGYRQFNHGEAVALGMVAVGQIAVGLGLWDPSCAKRQLLLIQKAGLPTQLPPTLDIPAVLDVLQTDKKVKAGQVQFVLPTQIGAATVGHRVPSEVIMRSLDQMQSRVSG